MGHDRSQKFLGARVQHPIIDSLALALVELSDCEVRVLVSDDDQHSLTTSLGSIQHPTEAIIEGRDSGNRVEEVIPRYASLYRVAECHKVEGLACIPRSRI